MQIDQNFTNPQRIFKKDNEQTYSITALRDFSTLEKIQQASESHPQSFNCWVFMWNGLCDFFKWLFCCAKKVLSKEEKEATEKLDLAIQDREPHEKIEALFKVGAQPHEGTIRQMIERQYSFETIQVACAYGAKVSAECLETALWNVEEKVLNEEKEPLLIEFLVKQKLKVSEVTLNICVRNAFPIRIVKLILESGTKPTASTLACAEETKSSAMIDLIAKALNVTPQKDFILDNAISYKTSDEEVLKLIREEKICCDRATLGRAVTYEYPDLTIQMLIDKSKAEVLPEVLGFALRKKYSLLTIDMLIFRIQSRDQADLPLAIQYDCSDDVIGLLLQRGFPSSQRAIQLAQQKKRSESIISSLQDQFRQSSKV